MTKHTHTQRHTHTHNNKKRGGVAEKIVLVGSENINNPFFLFRLNIQSTTKIAIRIWKNISEAARIWKTAYIKVTKSSTVLVLTLYQ